MSGLFALTLIQPWAYAVTHLGKRVENRTWQPPRAVWGQRIAIHAGKKLDDDAATFLRLEGLPVPEKLIHGAIVALCTVRGAVRNERAIDNGQRFWFAGPVGWLLGDVQVFAQPIACRGAQGLWRVPEDVAQQMERAALSPADERLDIEMDERGNATLWWRINASEGGTV